MTFKPLMRILNATLLVLLLSTCVSCQKEINPLSDNPGQPGNNTPSGDSYLPLTVGTKWQYNDSTLDVTYNSTVTSEKKTVSTVEFVKIKIEGTDLVQDGFMGKKGPNYYMLVQLYDAVIGNIDVTMRYLNDQEQAGFEWLDDAGYSGQTPVRVRGTIVGKGLTETVNGVTYGNVIHSRVVMEVKLFDNWDPINTYNLYSAKGVGVVRNRSYSEFLGIELYQTVATLLDYSIK